MSRTGGNSGPEILKWTKRQTCVLIFIFIDPCQSILEKDAEGIEANSQTRDSFHSHMGVSNNVISLKLLNFSIWLMELFFYHVFDVRDEPAQPSPTLPWCNSLTVQKNSNSNIWHDSATSFENLYKFLSRIFCLVSKS